MDSLLKGVSRKLIYRNVAGGFRVLCQTVVTLIKYICLLSMDFFQGDQPKITGSSQPGALCSYMFMNKIKQTYLFLRQWCSQISCGKGDELGDLRYFF